LKLLALVPLFAVLSIVEGCGGSGYTKQPVPQLVAITIQPTTSLLQLASNRQLLANGVFSDGRQEDITAQVTWGATPETVNGQTLTTNFVTVTPAGIATGSALGTSVVSATLGPVVGLLQLTVNTDGYSANTLAVIPAPSATTQVDAAYQPISQFKNSDGVYTVQALNLDADLSSSVLPVQTALIASIPMPPNFIPNATAGSQNSLKVAVIGYASPQVVVIDASNDPNDLSNNTVIGTFQSPVTKTTSFNGISCMICAAEVNPVTDQLILSTAQGYYSMDLATGTFLPLPASPQLFSAPTFAINPVFQNGSGKPAPYLLSPTFGQDVSNPSEFQTLDLNSGSVTSDTGLSLVLPTGTAINAFADQGIVVDAGANAQALLNLTNPQQPVSMLVQNLGVCPGGPQLLDMDAIGVGVAVDPTTVSPTLFMSQRSGSCVGFEVWPPSSGGTQLDPTLINYGYGVMPARPDGTPFVNGTDPNMIRTFTSVVNKKNYGLLVSGDQNWVAKVDLATVVNSTNQFSGFPLPGGLAIPAANLNAGIGGAAVVYLPTTGTVALSATQIDFGTQAVNTASNPSSISLTNAGITVLNISQIGIQGPDASDFAQTNTCPQIVNPKGACTISVTFTPSAAGTRTATLTITDDGGRNPQTVALSGTGN
jgi:hypothetical protein